MSRAICQFSFNILAWQVASDRLATPEQWQQWANNPDFINNLPEHKPALAFLPAMQRRRLSKAARLVCDAAWELPEKLPNTAQATPMVFASHDGELNRSFDLWLELFQTQTVSPTSFGLSVHNALAGQWSMLRQDMSESTALAVGSDGLETALAECYALLQDGTESVLLVLVDDPLRPDYAVKATRAPFAYTLAMLITSGNQYQLSLQEANPAPANTAEVEPYWGALEWVRFMLADKRTHAQHYRSSTWMWSKQK